VGRDFFIDVNGTDKRVNSSDKLIYDRPTGHLYYDADGNGSKARLRFAVPSDNTALDCSDFILI
jgi:Ca2+-binding RTX toxin-like protein